MFYRRPSLVLNFFLKEWYQFYLYTIYYISVWAHYSNFHIVFRGRGSIHILYIYEFKNISFFNIIPFVFTF